MKKRTIILILTLIILLTIIVLITIPKPPTQPLTQPQNQTNLTNSTSSNFVTRVIDGDTFELASGERVRMICVDSKEHDENSTRFLEELILNQTVRLEKDISDRDEYNRLLRYVFVGELFINKELVRQGYATIFPYGNDTRRCGEISGD